MAANARCNRLAPSGTSAGSGSTPKTNARTPPDSSPACDADSSDDLCCVSYFYALRG